VLALNLADVLRNAGLPVVEISGWKTRGHGELSLVASLVCHWTAGALTGETPSLNVVIHGRTGLPGPLSQLYLSRSGVWYTVASGIAYHAGDVIDPVYSNPKALGIEAEYHPNQGAWPVAQLESYARGCAAIANAYRLATERVRGHYEVARPLGRKPDPNNLDGGMPNFRQRVQRYRDNPEPPQPEIPEEKLKSLVLAKNQNGPDHWVGDGLTRRWVRDEAELNGLKFWIGKRGGDPEVYTFADLRVLGLPNPQEANDENYPG
jgi:hypothetical protein